ncbi:MAG: transglutaminase-like cysteine peptidase [Caulobacteraceae bacterium]
MQGAKLIAALIALGVCLSAGAAAAASFMAEGVPVAPPSGFVNLCRESDAACQGRTADAKVQLLAVTAQDSPVKLTHDLWAKLQRLNRSVNTRIKPMSDEALYGQAERWVDPLAGHLFDAGYVASGDCEDVALAKRDALIASGWPSGEMFLVVGYHRELGLHTVLAVRTDRGDLILDSRTPWIEPWTEAPYVWTKRQSAGDSEQWLKPHLESDTAARLASGVDGKVDQTASPSRISTNSPDSRW